MSGAAICTNITGRAKCQERLLAHSVVNENASKTAGL